MHLSANAHVPPDIAAGNATLLHVVKALGDFLTAEDEAVRTKGLYHLVGHSHHPC